MVMWYIWALLKDQNSHYGWLEELSESASPTKANALYNNQHFIKFGYIFY